MDPLPVGKPDKVTRINATYYQAHPKTIESRDKWQDDFAVVVIAIIVIIVIALMAMFTSPSARRRRHRTPSSRIYSINPSPAVGIGFGLSPKGQRRTRPSVPTP